MAMAELRHSEVGVIVPSEDRVPIRFFEGIAFKLRAKGTSAGDNTIRQRIGQLSGDLGGRGDFFIAHAKEYLRCFAPVKGVEFTNTKDVPTLLDQLNPTLEQLDTKHQWEVLEYLVHDATTSIVEQRQPRPAKAGRSDVTEGTRRVASEFVHKLENHIVEHLDPTPVPGATQFDRFVKGPVRLSESVLLVYLGLQLGACTPIRPTISPDVTPPAITQTTPGLETPSPTDFQVTPTDVYHFGSGGPISRERLLEMERQDPTVVKQIEWLHTWGDWYGSADPSIRPMTSDEARTDIVFYEWRGTDGSVHYKAAWKFDAAGYQGYVLVPPAINWEGLNPPVAAPAGHEIGPGQGPVKISIECLEGSDLAKLGVPVGAKLAPEQGTGNWVMVLNDKVVARVDETGVWQLEAPNVIFGLAATAEEVPDLGSMDKLIEAAKYFAAQPRVVASDQVAQMTVMEHPDVSEVQIFCNPGGLKNCAILATARVGEHYYIIVQFGTKTGPKNLLLYLGSSHLAYEHSVGPASIEALNNHTNSFSLRVYTRVKLADYDNPEIYRLTVGPNDPLPDNFQRLGEGEITDELEITPVWAGIQ